MNTSHKNAITHEKLVYQSFSGSFVKIVPIVGRDTESNFKDSAALLERSGINEGKLVEHGDVISTISVVLEEYGTKVVRLINVLTDWLPGIIQEGSEFWEDLVSIFNKLPNVIVDTEGNEHHLHLSPKAGKNLDTVKYLYLGGEGNYNILFETSAPFMYTAKKSMKEYLRQQNII